MKILTTVAEARVTLHALRCSPDIILGLVPTMGALHEGHLSLVRAARMSCDYVIVSIFVNPTQFGPDEDLARYPRTLEADCALLQTENVDFVFAPSAAEMYPSGDLSTFVDPGELGNRLDGRSRPGHFRGVTTVVSKLFNMLTPHRAFFGQKDAAQVAVLQAMVRDLNFPVDMIVCPTVRDPDGLALSSRNRYLSPEQRTDALALSRALACARREIEHGEREAVHLLQRMRSHLASPGLQVDYIEVVDSHTLSPQARVTDSSLLAIAAIVGETRLIDNLPIRDILPAVQA